MNHLQFLLKGGALLALTIFCSACLVAEPREGFYDRDHARYYHEHAWHDCGERSDFCR